MMKKYYAYGRVLEKNEDVMFDFCNTGIEFISLETVTLTIQTRKHVKLNVSVNDQFVKQYVIEGENKITELTFQKNDKVKIIKASEAMHGIVTILNFLSLPITAVEHPQRKRIEFIGDSLTSGYGNMGVSNEFESDCTQTWFVELADHFNCDFVNHSWGEIGLVEDWNLNRKNQIPEIRRRWLATDETAQFDFSLYPVDYVFINIGTNDLYLKEESLSDEFRREFIQAYKELIEECYQQYGEELKVFILQGPVMLPNGRKVVSEVVSLVRQERKNVVELDMSLSLDEKELWGFWDHPNVKGNHVLAEKLIKQLEEMNFQK